MREEVFMAGMRVESLLVGLGPELGRRPTGDVRARLAVHG